MSFLKIIPALLICVFFSAVGLGLGAYIGGNYLENLALFGVRGYEAAWPVGLMIGLICGVLISKQLLWRRRDPGPGEEDGNEEEPYR
jgi:hypothetical protein